MGLAKYLHLVDEPAPEPEVEVPLVVLLGAGASKLADVPLARAFVGTMRESDDDELAGQVGELEEFLKQRSPPSRVVDIELVYETVARLASPQDDPLIAAGDDLPLTPEEAQRLKRAVEEHIHERAFVKPEKTTYLDQLLALRRGGPLTVFSTNYDTCIEVLCERHRLRWEDGFRLRWAPAVFDEDGVDVRLHKLHGSVLWYRDQYGAYLRSPLRPEKGHRHGLEWFGGECEPLLIYPARKEAQDAPYAHNLELLRAVLGSRPSAVQLLVIGYSFRDQHVRQAVADAALANPLLSIVMVDPIASEIFETELSGSAESPSPLADRVFCINDGLDAEGTLLRDLAQYRLRRHKKEFAEEREHSLSGAGGRAFLDVAHSYAWIGDRQGHARCVERGKSAFAEDSDLRALLHALFDVLLAAEAGAPESEIRDAAVQLCEAIRAQLGSVNRPTQEGNGFENWSFNIPIREKEKILGQLREATRFSEQPPHRRSGSALAGSAAARSWFEWLSGFIDGLHTTKDGTGHLSFPALMERGILQARPTETEYRNPSMVRTVAEGLDRFLSETAPAHLLALLSDSCGTRSSSAKT